MKNPAHDSFKKQLDWVMDRPGGKRRFASAVFSWQMARQTVSELMENRSYVREESTEDERNFRAIQLEKLLMGYFFEMEDFFDHWASMLRDAGHLSDEIKVTKKSFKDSLKTLVKSSDLRDVRNGVAFHFTRFIHQPEELVRVYRVVLDIESDHLERVFLAMYECGEVLSGLSAELAMS